MTDLVARVAALEAELRALRAERDATAAEVPSSRRTLLRTAAVAAGAVGAAVVGARPAAAADNLPLVLGAAADGNNTATSPTTLTYGGPASDRSALSVGPSAPNAADRNNVFPGAVGGYGKGAVANGVHGSTTVREGYGVVATNVGDFDVQGPGPVALALVSNGAHLQMISNVGDAVLGTYPDGTLAYNAGSGLLLFVIDGQGGTRPVTLGRSDTASAFRLLPSAIRVYDSRTGTGPAATGDGKIRGGQVRELLLRDGFVGNEPTELFPPPGEGVMLNLTVTETEGSGFLSVYSADLTSFPGTSNINWASDGQNLANLVVTATTGFIKVQAGGPCATHFVIDVVGAYG